MIGRITFYNPKRRFGFISTSAQIGAGTVLEQHFFHRSNFVENEAPVIGAFVIFVLGDPIAVGKKPQAVAIRFATAQDIQAVKRADALKAGV